MGSGPRYQERLIDIIRKLAEDDKDGVMANKSLDLLWNLANSEDTGIELMQLALSAHVKILDYNCSATKIPLKRQWLDKCVEEVKSNARPLTALKHIMDICKTFDEVTRP